MLNYSVDSKYMTRNECFMMRSVLELDIQAIEDALVILRQSFRDTNNVKTAQTIIRLVKAKDHLYEMLRCYSEETIPGKQ